MDRVTSGAKAVVFELEIEAAVEIQGWTILIELGADSTAAGQNEVHLFLAG